LPAADVLSTIVKQSMLMDVDKLSSCSRFSGSSCNSQKRIGVQNQYTFGASLTQSKSGIMVQLNNTESVCVFVC